MDNIFNFLMGLSGYEMAVAMAVVMVIDIWSALRLQVVMQKGFLSKTFFKGLTTDFILIMIPIIIDLSTNFLSLPSLSSSGAAKVLALIATGLYMLGTIGSILANVTAIYPKDKNILTRAVYKILSAEIEKKLQYHLDSKDDNHDKSPK